MFVVDTDVIDAHMENLMESLHFPQVSHNHLNKSIDLFTITWTTLSELPTSVHNTMNNIFISFKKPTSKEKIFKGVIKTISGVLSKIKVAHYQVQIGGSVKVLIDTLPISFCSVCFAFIAALLFNTLLHNIIRLIVSS